MYPEDMLRRRYIVQSWRDTSIRHGFEEIEGPTFEQSDLYAVKSGEGILGELFQAFSGKSPEEVERVMRTGRAPFALRPEFTPTLTRMYAARARQLPKPTRWFTIGPRFRAERPQRGRLREFIQLDCDVVGTATDDVDGVLGSTVDTVTNLLDALACFGLSGGNVVAGFSDRDVIQNALGEHGVDEANLLRVLQLLDQRAKIPDGDFRERAAQLGLDVDRFDSALSGDGPDSPTRALLERLGALGFGEWVEADYSIVRGLAYYTGTVFEVIAEGERAIAGGGRYDNLIELLGGPPTPAVGFAMGDVVLGLLLEEKGLMPEGPDLMDAVSRPGASVRPEAFVIGADDEASDAAVRRLVADLRRGVESKAYLDKGDDAKPWHGDRYAPGPGGVRPLHARSSDKSTRNLKKLLADAERQASRFAVIVHGPDRVQIKDMDTRRDLTPADVPGLPPGEAEFAADPSSPVYVGRAIVALLAASR